LHLKIRNIFAPKTHNVIKIVTDGSANPKYRIGAWASYIITDKEEKILHGTRENTTQHVMELEAAIKSLEYLQFASKNVLKVEIYTDSEYVLNLIKRKDKLIANNFRSKKGKETKNSHLIRQFYEYLRGFDVRLKKVEGHTKKGISEITDYHREVDKLSRKLVRQEIKKADRDS
jgi:ribonuclease HI